MPLLSIVIPARLRPRLLQDAIASTLNQDFGDFELIVSNNGADADVRAVVSPFLADPRLRYIEQPDVLDMALHWERITCDIKGTYLLILSDRSVFKQGAFRRIAATLQDTQAEIISWPWDFYYEGFKLYLRYAITQGQTRVIDATHELMLMARGTHRYIYTLPRGLNSCVSRALVDRIRARQGQAFRPINPDLSFAFSCLLNSERVVYIGDPLFIAQGLSTNVSIGVFGDVRPRFSALGLAEPLKDVTVKVPLVSNGVVQDLLAAVREYRRSDIEANWNRVQYYLYCLDEIDQKRSSGRFSLADIESFERAVHAVLEREDEAVQKAVKRGRRSLQHLAARLIKRPLRDRYDGLRPYWLRLQGAKTCATVLDAAGFQLQNAELPPAASNLSDANAPPTRKMKV